MPRYLAIDWDQNRLTVLAANVGGGEVRVQFAASWQEEQPFGEAAAEAVGHQLRAKLKEAKVAPCPVIACLGRERLIVRDLRFPAVPEQEEPAIVRFQAVKELTVPAEDVVIDYVVGGPDGTGPERRAMVLVARKEQVRTLQKLCDAAGLKLAGITARPFGLAGCVDRLAGTTVLTPAPDPPGSPVAIVAMGEGWAEFCVARGGTPQLTRTLTPGPNAAGEIRRNLAIQAGQGAGQAVRAVYVAGGADAAGLRQKLGDILGVPVYPLDPFEGSTAPGLPGPEQRAAFVPLLGLLHFQGQPSGLPHDFVHPREPKPVKDLKKRRLALWGGLAGVVGLTLVGLAFADLNDARRKVKAQMDENAELDAELVGYEENARKIKALGDWNDHAVVWLDELYDLTDRFPEPGGNALRLTQFNAGVVERAPNSKDKHIAKIALKGITGEDYRPVDLLVSRLVEDKYYRVDPKKLSRNTGPDRFTYPQQFQIERIDIEKRPPEKYVRKIEPVTEETRSRGR